MYRASGMQLNQIHPLKGYKEFTGHLKKVYEAAGRKAAEEEFERFKQAWSQYPRTVDVWVRNW